MGISFTAEPGGNGENPSELLVSRGGEHGKVIGMDHGWAAAQLRSFSIRIDNLRAIRTGQSNQSEAQGDNVADELITLDPVMRDLMNAARPGFGDYLALEDTTWSHYSSDYWYLNVKPWVLRAIGVHELGAEARMRMRPSSPDIVADQLHPWVWEAAAPMWEAGSTQESVHTAARSVNARLQQKLGRHDKSETSLCREAFSLKDPVSGQPRLRFPGDRTTDTWRSRQQAGIEFGAGCFEGIRNPAAHEHQLNLPEQVALEQLAAFSVLARWIDECTVETAP